MTHLSRTPQQLADMYLASRNGVGSNELSESLKIPYGSVVTALRTLKDYINGKARTKKRQSRTYKEAAKLIRKQLRDENTAPLATPDTEPQGDHFSSLRNSFAAFQNSLTSFLDAELTKRTAALQEEIQTLREENDQLRKQVEELRTIDWVNALEDRFTQEEQ